jgi:hypothetical protein
MTGAWLVFIFVVAMSAAILALLHYTRAGDLLHRHIPDTPRRRILLSSIAFFLTFAGVRALTWSIHNGVGPFHDIHMGGRWAAHSSLGIWHSHAADRGLRLDDRCGRRTEGLEIGGTASALPSLWRWSRAHLG